MTNRFKRNWHGWAFALSDGKGGETFCHWAESFKPQTKPSSDGRWAKVRFVEVKGQKDKG